MPSSEDNLKAYFDKVIELQNSRTHTNLSESDLKGIAQDLGFSEKDWQFIEKSFQDHLKRGEGHARHANWTDAIEEFNQALILKPSNVQTLYGLANAHKGRWEDNNSVEDKEKALTFARQCLNIKADYPEALRLVSEIRKEKEQQLRSTRVPHENIQSKHSKRNLSGMLSVIFLLIVVFVGTGFFNSLFKSKPQRNNKSRTALEQEQRSNTRNRPNTTTSANNNQLPLSFKTDAEKSKGLKFVPQQSSFNGRANYYNYTATGHLVVEGDIAVNRVSLRIDFLDAEGKVLLSDLISLAQRDITYYKGDCIPLRYFKYESSVSVMPDWKSTQISIDFIEKVPSQAVSFPKKDFTWLSPKAPAGVDLEIRERESKFSFYTSSSYHKVKLEFINTGTKPISKLRAKLEWLDASGNVFHTNDRLYINNTSKPLIEKGQNRIFQGTYSLNGRSQSQVSGYRIVVVEAN